MSHWSKTKILRANVGMIRDAFLEKDKISGEFILGIRQVKFNTDGALFDAKLIRLTEAEATDLVYFWAKRGELDGANTESSS